MLPGQVVRLKELFHYQIGSLEVVVFFFTPSDKSSRVKSKKENQAASSQTTNHIYLIWGLGK